MLQGQGYLYQEGLRCHEQESALIGPRHSIEEAASAMTRHKINRLPVVEDGKLIGIVTRGDIISGLGRGS